MNTIEREAKQFMEERYGQMDMNEYQKNAVTTAVYPPQHKILYPALGLAGEAGEVANKVKKIIRDGTGKLPADWREQLASEIGDVLWYCAALSEDLGYTLGRIAKENEVKLASRKKKGTLQGSGDKR
jgi:NTP pyrophosphatase (non-canonical NTP hydrolase)